MPVRSARQEARSLKVQEGLSRTQDYVNSVEREIEK